MYSNLQLILAVISLGYVSTLKDTNLPHYRSAAADNPYGMAAVMRIEYLGDAPKDLQNSAIPYGMSIRIGSTNLTVSYPWTVMFQFKRPDVQLNDSNAVYTISQSGSSTPVWYTLRPKSSSIAFIQGGIRLSTLVASGFVSAESRTLDVLPDSVVISLFPSGETGNATSFQLETTKDSSQVLRGDVPSKPEQLFKTILTSDEYFDPSAKKDSSSSSYVLTIILPVVAGVALIAVIVIVLTRHCKRKPKVIRPRGANFNRDTGSVKGSRFSHAQSGFR